MSRKSDETRKRILNSAWRLLESGDTSVRMADIAAASKLSRQAVYLHFPKRADLLIAVTKFIDDEKNMEDRLAASRQAQSGAERLDAFVESWCNYIPEIYGVARALMAMQDHDAEAENAWKSRMLDMKEGCAAAVGALEKDGVLSPDLTVNEASDLLWTMLSVRNYELLTQECGWAHARYVSMMRATTKKVLTGA